MAPVASKPIDGAAATPDLPTNDNVAHAIAGAGGGILSTVLTYPLITLSTRAQVESKRAQANSNGPSPSFLATVERIVAREGVSGLYAGLDSAVFGIGVTNFVYYYWYEWSRALFERRAAGRPGRVAGRLTTVESMLAGALAGSATVILTNPIWVVNTRMTVKEKAEEKVTSTSTSTSTSTEEKTTESSTVLVEADKTETAAKEVPRSVSSPSSSSPSKASTFGTLLALLREEGPQALFAGVVPALVLVINPILQYTLFEQLKNLVEARQRHRGGPASITPATAFVLGALGKLFATSITYPYITVKSRMHVAKERTRGGVTAALRQVVRDEGYAGLYRGIVPKVTQSVLTAAFLFAFKDVLYAQTVRLRSKVATKALA